MRTTFPIDAPPAAWAALGDPEVLAAALPGCRSVTATGDGDGTLHVVADLAVASVHGLWAGSVVRVDADSLRIAGSGEPGTVDLVVRSDPSRTALTVEGTVEGPLATVGSAVLAAVIRRIAEDVLAAATAPAPSRGDGGEPMTSGGRSHRRAPGRLPGRAAAVAGVIVVVVLGRRRARRRAG